jgi:hypothetical protein
MTPLELILSKIPENYQRRRLRRHFPQPPFAAAAASSRSPAPKGGLAFKNNKTANDLIIF